MSEKIRENFEEEPKKEQIQETKSQPRVEMPESFIEPEGKSGKWNEVVEDKELGVSYREKVITLPKHRQEETDINHIIRREVLTYPRNFYTSEDQSDSGIAYYSGEEKFDDVYRFLTNERFPSPDVWVHIFSGGEKDPKSYVSEFKKERLYFQEVIFTHIGHEALNTFERTEEGIKRQDPHYLYDKHGNPKQIPKNQLALSKLWLQVGEMYFRKHYNTPVFVFSNKNEIFNQYVDTVLANPEAMEMIYNATRNPDPSFRKFVKHNLDNLQSFRKGNSVDSPVQWIQCVRHPDIKPLRWCHSELALVPTKRNLNVLFFKSGGEDKK